MDKKKNCSSKQPKLEPTPLSREYIHSISRIGDRLKALKRDFKNLREDVFRDLTDMEEDAIMLSDAFDSLFNDLLEKLHDKDMKHNVEEI